MRRPGYQEREDSTQERGKGSSRRELCSIPTERRLEQEDSGLQEGFLQENQDRRDTWCDSLKNTIQRKSD